ncbi:hypothetical protein Fcan01_27631 [Folsomia candida]|uniref:Uncharacterized protein n=1 Tax=Folsomia candida TaxID=158441 RepID=A0A226CW24_FOLCA|nr:hypothetical protein Fcan01_27631 [Folsomia candida]
MGSELRSRWVYLSNSTLGGGGSAVPVSRKLSRRLALLDYVIRLLVWAGILLPPPVTLVFLLLRLDPWRVPNYVMGGPQGAATSPHSPTTHCEGAPTPHDCDTDRKTPFGKNRCHQDSNPGPFGSQPCSLAIRLSTHSLIMTFIISKSPEINTFTASLSLVNTIILFVIRYIFFLLVILDIFRCFILLAIVSFIGIQLFKNLIDLADGYLDEGVLRQSNIEVYRTVGIIYRVPVSINKFGTFIAITFLGASSVLFAYIVIRLHDRIPTALCCI